MMSATLETSQTIRCRKFECQQYAVICDDLFTLHQDYFSPLPATPWMSISTKQLNIKSNIGHVRHGTPQITALPTKLGVELPVILGGAWWQELLGFRLGSRSERAWATSFRFRPV